MFTHTLIPSAKFDIFFSILAHFVFKEGGVGSPGLLSRAFDPSHTG